jgi:hypothetical protein
MHAEPTSITVRVDDQEWRRVRNFDAAAPDDAVYVLDAENGTVRFGDGQHGRRPPPGSVVTISSGSGVKRPAFFDGQLLRAEDFREEQRYESEKRRLHNRALHGAGVASGLEVALTPGVAPTSVVVQPGFALDSAGREIELCDRVTVEITSRGSPVYVLVEYGERETHWSPSPIDPSQTIATRVEEFARIRLSPDHVSGEGIALARLIQTVAGWNVDTGYRRTQCR